MRAAGLGRRPGASCSCQSGLHLTASRFDFAFECPPHATLQRRLANEGTSFQSLKDALRHDVAIVRLNTSAVPLATVAYELGFADSSPFQRVFKGWTGSAPGAYRRGGL